MAVIIIDMDTGRILEESGVEKEEPKAPEERPRIPAPQPRLQVVTPTRKDKDKGWHPIYGV